MSHVDVLIAGAGPTGLMAANLCKLAGLTCRIIDQSAEQAHESRALAVQAKSLELFQNLGVVDDLLARGQVARGLSVFVRGEEKVHLDFADIGRQDTPYPYVFILSQAETERILAENFARLGGRIEHQTKLEDLVDDGKVVRATVLRPDGTTEVIEADDVIGADGSHSFVRHHLGLRFEGGAYQDDFLLADARVDWDLPHDRVTLFFNTRNLALFFPIAGKQTSRVFALDPAPPKVKDTTRETTSSPADLEGVEAALREAAGRPVRLSDPKWLARFHLHHRGVDRYRVGRIFVAGDAAHIHSPVGGQGMNTGLQDAANLVWKIALVRRGIASDRLLDTYHSERFPVGEKLLKFTDRVFELITDRGAWRPVIRDVALPIVARLLRTFPPLRKRAFHFVSQLNIRYHESDAVVDRAVQGGPAAGERWPDARLAGGRTLLALAGGYRFHLFVVTREQLSLAETQKLLESLETLESGPLAPRAHLICPRAPLASARIHEAGTDEVFDRLGVISSATYLVRPDGMIAERRSGTSLEGLGQRLMTARGT